MRRPAACVKIGLKSPEIASNSLENSTFRRSSRGNLPRRRPFALVTDVTGHPFPSRYGVFCYILVQTYFRSNGRPRYHSKSRLGRVTKTDCYRGPYDFTSGLQCTHYPFVTLTVIWGTALLHTCDGTTQRTRNTPLLGPRVGRCRVLLEARGPKKYSFTRTRLQRYRAVREPPAPSGNCNCEHSVRQTSTFGDEVIPLIRRSCQRPQRAQGSRGARQIYSP